jgi:peptidoglycan/LPS O-acetylase OafA/YrhL
MSERISAIPELHYRPDIDGLRAVAVLSVLASHLDMTRLAGGFVGVDIFFVISGYLISSIILKDIGMGRFSIVGFYERRIRRIFPALFIMLLAVSIGAIIFLLPSELISYGNALLSTLGFASNFYFLSNSNYFDLPTTSPLLHTWSLAVEEQFYLVFPLFILLIRKFFPQRFKVAIAGMAIASFLLSVVLVPYHQNNAFYMLYTRAWELLIGTMLSQRMFPRIDSLWLRNLVTLIGFTFIAYPVIFYTLATPFPGLNALMPCLGTALIIGAGESGSSVVGTALTWRPVVFIGLISYSLYLWHWPVIVFHRMGIINISSLGAEHLLGALLTRHRLNLLLDIGLPIVLAAISWRFIERPFRSGKLRLTGRPLFALAGGVMCVFVALSLTVIATGGFPRRFSEASLQMAAKSDITEFAKATRGGICFVGGGRDHFENFDTVTCLREDPTKKNYLLLGDSKAAMLYPGLSLALQDVNLMQANNAGCGAFFDPSGDRDCIKMMKFIYEDYLPKHRVDTLILCKHWAPNDLDRLAETVQWSKKNQIPLIIVGPNPTYDIPFPRLEAYSIAWKKPEMVREHLDSEVKPLDDHMAELAKNTWQVEYVSLYKAICQNGSCREFADSAKTIPMLLDQGHLSPAASALVARSLVSEGVFH